MIEATALGAPIFTTTGDVRALIDQLQSGTDVLNHDITQSWFPTVKSDVAANDFVNGWIIWRDATYRYVTEWRGKIFWLAWNWYDSTAAKLQELLNWRKSFEAISGRTATGPAPKPPPDASAPYTAIINAALVIAVIGGTAYLGAHVYGAYRTAQHKGVSGPPPPRARLRRGPRRRLTR